MPSVPLGSIPKRLLPEEPLPPYAYVPRRFAHPTRDPAGHSYGNKSENGSALVPERWPESRAYLRGLDLFNSGYYWEAHEAWEHLWHRGGRTGTVADFLKGLIAFAAAGVKAREGAVAGVRSHAIRARQILLGVQEQCGVGPGFYCGLHISTLVSWATALSEKASETIIQSEEAVVVVMPFALVPT